MFTQMFTQRKYASILDSIMKKDRCTLIGTYDTIDINTQIHYSTHCGCTHSMAFWLIVEKGCRDCPCKKGPEYIRSILHDPRIQEILRGDV